MLQQESDWKAVYMAALLEDDKSRIPTRVASAQNVLRERLIELHYAVEQRTERDRIEHALKMLNLLMITERAVQ